MRTSFQMFVLTAALVFLTLPASADKVTYTYDDAGRLTRVDYDNGRSISYSYDKNGNLLSRVVTAPETPTEGLAANASKKTEAARKPAKPNGKRRGTDRIRR